jgi:hypothetical protein
VSGPPEPETNGGAAANGTPNSKPLLSKTQDKQTAPTEQELVLNRRFAIGYDLAMALAPLIWGLPR